MKKMLALFISIAVVFAMIPPTRTCAEEDVVLTVTADRESVTAGDEVEFTVSIAAVRDLGALQFNLVIPDGLSFVKGSAKLTEGIQETLNSDGDIAVPTEKNKYVWAYSARKPGYSKDAEQAILTFSCTVDDVAKIESAGVSLSVDGCYSFSAIEDMSVRVNPASLKAGKSKAAPAPTADPGTAPTPAASSDPAPDPAPAPAHEHTGIVKHPAVAATCVAGGNVEYWTCSSSECADKYYKDESCKSELLSVATPVDPDNHVGGDGWSIDADKHFHKCACGAVLDEEAHVYDDDADAGCNVCGHQRFGADSGGTGTGTSGSGKEKADPSAAPQKRSAGKEPKTGTPNLSIVSLAIVAGLAYVLDTIITESSAFAMKKEKKDRLIRGIVEKSRSRRAVWRLFALIEIVAVLAYYHSIGKRCGEKKNELAQHI